MSAIAPDQSIRAETGGRPDLLVFEIVAKITEADIAWMAARVQGAFDTLGEIDMLIIMRHFDGAELGAMFDADAMKVQMRSLKHVRRYGVVGAPFWAKAMINLFSPLTPVEEKTFALEEEDAARIWISTPRAAAS